jgi:hypothetical protein
VPGDTQHFEGESLQCNDFGGHRGVVRARKSMKKLAPQVGLEPTTLRLTAWESVYINSSRFFCLQNYIKHNVPEHVPPYYTSA